jgi:hypothetical protein
VVDGGAVLGAAEAALRAPAEGEGVEGGAGGWLRRGRGCRRGRGGVRARGFGGATVAVVGGGGGGDENHRRAEEAAGEGQRRGTKV